MGHYGYVTIKHATASTFVFANIDGGWRLGLILHPLLGKLMIPGGHVERDENEAEAAGREVAEETGLAVTFLPAPTAPAPPEVVATGKLASPPWWIIEQPIGADNHVAEPHVHVDHLYVAIATVPESLTTPAHPFGWHEPAELANLNMFDDTRQFAFALFAGLDTFEPQS